MGRILLKKTEIGKYGSSNGMNGCSVTDVWKDVVILKKKMVHDDGTNKIFHPLNK
jgi:dihydroxyacetone kinase